MLCLGKLVEVLYLRIEAARLINHHRRATAISGLTITVLQSLDAVTLLAHLAAEVLHNVAKCFELGFHARPGRLTEPEATSSVLFSFLFLTRASLLPVLGSLDGPLSLLCSETGGESGFLDLVTTLVLFMAARWLLRGDTEAEVEGVRES